MGQAHEVRRPVLEMNDPGMAVEVTCSRGRGGSAPWRCSRRRRISLIK